MRLLHTREIQLKEFLGNSVPPYAILSHTWDGDEVTLENVRDGTAAQHGAYRKLLGACARAQKDSYDWIWIDTCCIDKSSSSELQEAINTMYRWYQHAHVCYAYLVDVPDCRAGWDTAFERSRWWKRGWTLRMTPQLGPRSLWEFC